MTPDLKTKLHQLIDDYRTRCLWFLQPDLYPETDEQTLRILNYIEIHGDRQGFIRSRELKQWLSPPINEPSAG